MMANHWTIHSRIKYQIRHTGQWKSVKWYQIIILNLTQHSLLKCLNTTRPIIHIKQNLPIGSRWLVSLSFIFNRYFKPRLKMVLIEPKRLCIRLEPCSKFEITSGRNPKARFHYQSKLFSSWKFGSSRFIISTRVPSTLLFKSLCLSGPLTVIIQTEGKTQREEKVAKIRFA